MIYSKEMLNTLGYKSAEEFVDDYVNKYGNCCIRHAPDGVYVDYDFDTQPGIPNIGYMNMNEISATNSSTLEVTTKLPTREEFKSAIEFNPEPEYSEPKYACEQCGGGMCRNNRIVLTSYPPKYLYKCNKCGYVDYMGR